MVPRQVYDEISAALNSLGCEVLRDSGMDYSRIVFRCHGMEHAKRMANQALSASGHTTRFVNITVGNNVLASLQIK